jgi:hypothetical protein
MTMGVALIGEALRVMDGNTKLSGNARSALLAMAYRALDKGKGDRPPRVYFGGWLYLQASLRGEITPASHRAVARAMDELTDQGLIVKVRHGGRTTAAYELLLGTTKGDSA